MWTPTISQCPSCQQMLQFSSDQVNMIVCNCGSVVIRRAKGALAVKSVSVISQPYEMIQPGTTGKWEGRDFRVLGRFRVWLSEAVFNYWTVCFADGELAYLGEGYGLFAIMRKTEVLDSALRHLSTNDIRDEIKLVADQSFFLEKKGIVRRVDVEGEFWLPDFNASFSIHDFASVSLRHVTIFQFREENSQAFDVSYVSSSNLQLTNTRQADSPGKSFSCENCGGEVYVKTWPYAQSCVCNACGMHHALKNDQFRKLGQINSTDIEPGIAIGSTGIINGIQYECVGHTLKEEVNKYAAQWNEYALYNREEGYAFLSEFEGHWIYVREQGRTPVLSRSNATSFEFDKEPFQLFNSYHFTIVNAHGEFPNNIFNSIHTAAREYISPPEVWIQEFNKEEGIVWFLGRHISGKTLKNQFHFPNGLPAKQGIGAVEPKFYMNPQKLMLMAFIGVVFLSMIHVLMGFSKQERVLLDETYSFRDSTDRVTFVTPKYHLDKWRSNLEFYIAAPVSNDWFELDATLVNAKTGTEYSLEKGLEYYYGYSEGEYWTEGSASEKAWLTYIPAGDYFLQIQGIRSVSLATPLTVFSLRVTYDVPNDRNLWWSLVFLICWPVIQHFRTNHIEKKRWYNSPFSSYAYED